jgi:predicted nucleic acid-binding protein
MGQYLIDNNVISNYFSGGNGENALDFVAKVIDQVPNISVITEIEALSWVNKDQNKEKILKAFVREANILGLTRDVVNECVKIRRTKKLKTPDAIIAGTAIAYGLTLITSDSDFNNVPGLQIINPASI